MYILAGKKKLKEVREGELAQITAKAQQSGLPEDAQEARDLDSMCNRFEKKLHDLEPVSYTHLSGLSAALTESR